MSFYNSSSDSPIQNVNVISVPSVNINAVMRLVYVWMGLGLLTTAAVAWFTATNPALESLRTNGAVMVIAMIAMFGSVIGLSVGLRQRWMTPNIAAALFFVFAGIEGFSLSLLLEYFIANQPGALYAAFGTAAGLFGAMSLVGLTTNTDLTSWGTYLFAGLIGLVIAMFLNWFIGSSTLAFLISIGGVVVFTALTAYDTQKIKEITTMPELQSDGNMVVKFSILGALTLYLDFINLFLFLLRIFGGGSDD
jgi:FtsH-binding integral membrane protein